MRFFNEKEFMKYYYEDFSLVEVSSYFPHCGVFQYSQAHLQTRLNELSAWFVRHPQKTALKTKVSDLTNRLQQKPSCYKMLGDNNFLTAVWFMEIQNQKVMLFLSNKGFSLYVEKNHKIKDVFAVLNELLSNGNFA